MRQEDDRRVDHVEQRDVGVARQRFLPAAREELNLRFREMVEDLVADPAGPGPLRVLLGLRVIAARGHCRERFFEVLRRADVQVQLTRCTIDPRHVLRASARREILQIDDVAHLEEVVGPARTAVRGLEPVDTGLSGAVQEDNGIWRPDLSRHHHLDIHRPSHGRFLVRPQFADVFAACKEEPVAGDLIERNGRNRGRHGARLMVLPLGVRPTSQPDDGDKKCEA